VLGASLLQCRSGSEGDEQSTEHTSCRYVDVRDREPPLLAVLLGQRGRRVTVVEKWPEPYDQPRAVTYDHEIARFLSMLGIDSDNDPAVEYHDDLYFWRNARGENLLAVNWKSVAASGWRTRYWFNQPDLERRVLDMLPQQELAIELTHWQLRDPGSPTTIVPGGPGGRRWEFMVSPGESASELSSEESAWRLLKPWGVTPEGAALERSEVCRFQSPMGREPAPRKGIDRRRCRPRDATVRRRRHVRGRGTDPAEILTDRQRHLWAELSGRYVRIGDEQVDGDVRDIEGTYGRRLDDIGADFVILRPDFHLAAMASHTGQLQTDLDVILDGLRLNATSSQPTPPGRSETP
jgi:hypothetical protein